MKRVQIGQIVGAFGIKGQVKVKILTDFVERFDVGRRVWLDGKPTEVIGQHWHGEQLLLNLSAIANRNDAEASQWCFIEAVAEEQPDLDEDEFLTSDLIGMAVVTDSGEALGYVDDVLALPAQDVLVVGELMIPAVKEYVLEVDLETRQIQVHLIPGMRPGEEA